MLYDFFICQKGYLRQLDQYDIAHGLTPSSSTVHIYVCNLAPMPLPVPQERYLLTATEQQDLSDNCFQIYSMSLVNIVNFYHNLFYRIVERGGKRSVSKSWQSSLWCVGELSGLGCEDTVRAADKPPSGKLPHIVARCPTTRKKKRKLSPSCSFLP